MRYSIRYNEYQSGPSPVNTSPQSLLMPLSKIVGRTLDFLELFADQKRPLSVSETARLLDLPASSSHDVLKTLQERG